MHERQPREGAALRRFERGGASARADAAEERVS